MKEVRMVPLPCKGNGEECSVELPAEARVLRVGMVSKVSPIVGENGQRAFSAGPVLRVEAQIGALTVPRRFVVLVPGQAIQDWAIYVGSAVGRFPNGEQFDIDVFEIPPGVRFVDDQETSGG